MLKHSVIVLYSGENDIASHQVRLVLSEKSVDVSILSMEEEYNHQKLLKINPYGDAPTLVDRDLVLYNPRLILEYLEERFPYPPLLPVYPIARARSRLMIYRIEKDWYSLLPRILSENQKDGDAARKELIESLSSIDSVFAQTPYFLSEEFSLVDCYLAPLLWRLPHYGVELPKRARHTHNYLERIFEREGFQNSLTDEEYNIRCNDDF